MVIFPLIELSVDNTLKFVKEKSFGLSKRMKHNKDNNENKKDNQKKKAQNQELVFEDLPYEKEIKEIQEKAKKRNDEILKKKESVEAISRIHEKRALSLTRNSMKKSANDNKDKKSNISDILSFMDDLALPKVGDNINRKNATLNRINSFLIDYDNENIKKGIYHKDKTINKENYIEDEKENENDITNKSLISKESNDEKLRLKVIKLKDKDDLYSSVSFKKPYSILTSVINLKKDKEIQEKMDKIRKNFKLDKYLEKETERGVNVDSLGRRKSFLDFMQYTNKRQNLDQYLQDEEKISKGKKERNIFELLNKKNKNEEKKSKKDSQSSISEDENKEKNNLSYIDKKTNV